MVEGELSQSARAYDALRWAKGNISLAADALEMTRSAMVTLIKGNAVLTELTTSLRDRIVDKAEGNVFDDVEKGDPTASRLVVTTLGRDRGWTTRTELANRDPLEVHIRTFAGPPAEAAEGPDGGQD